MRERRGRPQDFLDSKVPSSVTPEAAAAAPVDPDWEVLRRVAQGEVEAFGPLVERHQARLLRVCARLLHDSEEARDAAQEVFLKAFRGAASFEPGGRVFTWLYRIAVNHCLNRLRRRSLVRFLSLTPADDDEPALDPPDAGPDAERALDAERRWRATRRQIEHLPANQRAVLVLAKFEGLSYREIAAVLSTTESAVESRLVRAMRTLVRAQGGELSAVSDKGVKG
jgi:RNA polymerase sigma-70 factor (ECF subfamily)